MNDNDLGDSGSERRQEQRRKTRDRREEIRYEPEKELRRSGNGRRQGELEDIWNTKRS
jgi:hypothetical protein